MGRADYLLRRDVGKSGTGLQDLWGESLDQQAGINKYRGIGRGLGTLGGILLAGSGAGIPLLALAGGLGSFGGSQIGKHLGQQRYGDPVKAEKGGLFHRDVAKEQRESVGDYWKGMKEQIAVNTLQDAITAGMYGSQIQKFAGMGKPMAAPMTPNVPISSPAQPQMLGDEALSQLTSNWSPDALKMADPASGIAGTSLSPSAFKSGVTTSAPSTISQNITSYPNVSVPPPAKIDPNALNFQQVDRSAINAGRDRTLQSLDANQGMPGVQFSSPSTIGAIDNTGAAISTDPTATYKPDWLSEAVGNTGGQMTPSLSGDMQQRIAYYKNRQWAPDPTIDQTMWSSWGNPQNKINYNPAPVPQQNDPRSSWRPW